MDPIGIDDVIRDLLAEVQRLKADHERIEGEQFHYWAQKHDALKAENARLRNELRNSEADK